MWYITCCRWIRKIVFASYRFPCIRHEEIEKNIAVPSTPPEDLAEYLKVSSKSSHKIVILILIYTAYCIKDTWATFQVLRMFNHRDIESNIRRVGDNWHQFACITTNCPRFSQSSSLAQELAKLPLYAICHPNLAQIYTPILYLDALGLLAFAISSFGVLLLGAIVPVQRLLYSTSVEIIMFVLAPTVTSRLVRDRIAILMEDVSSSLQNFTSVAMRRDPLFRCYPRTPEDGPGKSRRISGELEEAEIDQFMADCLPSIRTPWWRGLAAKMIVFMASLLTSILAAVAVLLVAYIQSNILRKIDFVDGFRLKMMQTNCSIWRSEDPGRNEVDLDEIGRKYLRWNLYSGLETFFVNFCPVFSIFLQLSYFYGLAVELNCWLDELRCELLLAIDLNKLKSTCRLEARNSRVRGKSPAAIVREKFCRNADYPFIMLLSNHKLTEPNLKSRTARRNIVWELILDEGIDNAKYLEMLEKIYLNFRLFTESVRLYAPSMTTLIFTTYVLNYSLVLISLWFIKNMNNFFLEPLVLGVIGYLVSNVLILMAANFHANAKKLPPLVWTLIARLTDMNDIETRHLRHIWLKKAQVLDNEGGIALRAFNIRITYVNIIQLVIWTATLLLMALKD